MSDVTPAHPAVERLPLYKAVDSGRRVHGVVVEIDYVPATRADVLAVFEAPEMRWCEIHGDWSPIWDGSDVPSSLCRWAHHVLKDSPDKPCRIVQVFLVPAEETANG
jgi:hypothetical protein